MDEKIQKILEFVERSLIVSIDNKDLILNNVYDLNQDDINELFSILLKIDSEQTQIIADKLEEEPWFFMQLQWIINRTSYEENLKDELSELNNIECNFETILWSV